MPWHERAALGYLVTRIGVGRAAEALGLPAAYVERVARRCGVSFAGCRHGGAQVRGASVRDGSACVVPASRGAHPLAEGVA